MQNDFDIASVSYDETFTNTTIGKAQRMQVYKQLNKLVKVSETLNILELNCGTGQDANYLNTLNHTITATDISNEMISVASKKNSPNEINFHQLDINELQNHSFKDKFDLIFSNFGGFNCLSKEQIATFFSSAKKIMTKKGKIVLVVMPKQTFWEKIYFFLKGDFKKAQRRNSNEAIKANVDGVTVKTWYFNPKEIVKIAHEFSVENTKPIGLFVPPSYLQSSFLGNKKMVTILNGLDKLFGFSFLSNYADHYYIELQKSTDL